MADPLEERLKPLRDAIDAIDGKVVELLNERARVAAGRIGPAEFNQRIAPFRAAELIV